MDEREKGIWKYYIQHLRLLETFAWTISYPDLICGIMTDGPKSTKFKHVYFVMKRQWKEGIKPYKWISLIELKTRGKLYHTGPSCLNFKRHSTLLWRLNAKILSDSIPYSPFRAKSFHANIGLNEKCDLCLPISWKKASDSIRYELLLCSPRQSIWLQMGRSTSL